MFGFYNLKMSNTLYTIKSKQGKMGKSKDTRERHNVGKEMKISL